MIGGIFFLINPQGAMNLWNSVQGSSNLENGDKNPEEYSWFASLFGKKNLETPTIETSTGSEETLSWTVEESGSLVEDISENISGSLENITNNLSGDALETTKKGIFLEDGIERDEAGNYVLDAEKYEVGVVEGKLIISLKKETPEEANSEINAIDIDSEEVISEPVTPKTKAKSPVKKATQNSSAGLSAQDLREAEALFGR